MSCDLFCNLSWKVYLSDKLLNNFRVWSWYVQALRKFPHTQVNQEILYHGSTGLETILSMAIVGPLKSQRGQISSPERWVDRSEQMGKGHIHPSNTTDAESIFPQVKESVTGETYIGGLWFLHTGKRLIMGFPSIRQISLNNWGGNYHSVKMTWFP